ncbi:methionyl-tRNA formyltransferase [Acetobacteraceae bacterium]|nr:methionyl-tRNA formyltransferase [Acetobacteraceae bacterium]
MRLIFMGSPEFSVPALNALIESGHEVVAVYTQPPRPTGRGNKITKQPVHLAAEKAGIEVRCPERLRKRPEILKELQELKADLAVVCAYGLLLPQEVLDAPRLGCINIHASILPRWRGASPIQAAIAAGDKETGVTLMQMDAGLDTGDILEISRLPILPEDTAETLSARLSHLGAERIKHLLQNPLPSPTPQPTEGVTTVGRLKREDAQIDWHQSAQEIENKFRAYQPWPGSFTYLNGEKLKIGDLKIVKTPIQHSTKPGLIIAPDLTVATGNGFVSIEKIQKPGRKMVSAKDFLNGNHLESDAAFDSK